MANRGARRVWGLAVTCALAAACSSAPDDGGSADTTTTVAATSTTARLTTTTTTLAPSTTDAPAPDDPYAQPGWVAAENALPGTADWRLIGDPADPVRDTPTTWIEGYADRTSAQFGDTVTLFVDTPAPEFTVVAYRMGWYGGLQAREVWRSSATPGARQPSGTFDRATGMTEAPWAPSLTVEVTDAWPPGAYLLKLATGLSGGHYIPLTVRHDAAAGDLLFMNAVTTWQAYNPWGGCTLYECFEPQTKFRAEVVSFDRPYAHSYAQGAADFPTHELPLLSFIEEQGFDVAYITNIDLHREPSLAGSRKALVSTGHDEYYSWPMRGGLVTALDAGTNIGFFGANAVYRNIRLEPGASGAPDRREVNYRVRDPGAGGDPHLVTVNWRELPLKKPEAEIVGLQYG
ncbi:MAG: N,N-dimethylformamidase beta subunit family domain-containing protein, partial [Ilumatobacteraceae bacterium]